MSRLSHSQLKLAMPSVHGPSSIAPKASSSGPPVRDRGGVKLGLGVNQRTGRVQWCPGLTCCKLFLLLPVVMLPLTLVLILIMRLDGMLAALQLSEQRMRDRRESPGPGYVDDYESLLPEGSSYNELIHEEFLLPQSKRDRLAMMAAERAKRCQPYRYGQAETLDLEERSTLMKDSRTSFLPQGIPRECVGDGINLDIKPIGRDSFRRQKKRYQDNAPYWLERIRQRERREAEHQSGESSPDLSVQINEATAALQSFWNEEGTKEGIRLAQAKTMKRYMDTKVDPCVDFYKYACGNWEKLHPIPKDKAGFDTFEMLRESLDLVLRNLLEKGGSGHGTTVAGAKKNRARNTFFKLNAQGGSEEEEVGESEQAEVQVAERLRRDIVSRRRLLNQVLVRYKRFSNGTKRKRVIVTGDRPKEEASAPTTKLKAAEDNRGAATELLAPQEDAQLKAKNLYRSCVNSDLLAHRGLEPLLTLIRELGGWPVLDPEWSGSEFNWQVLAATLRRYNNDILIVQWVGADIKNSEENIIQFDQTGLGLPTREYFLQSTNTKYLLAYQRYMSEVMHKLGASKEDSERVASELVAFETKLAGITSPAEQRLNVTKLYKRMTLDRLQSLVPEIKWLAYLQTLQDREVNSNEEVVIYAVDYMSKLVKLLEETETHTVANYMMWRFVRHRINNVDDRFDDIKQHFYHALFGREESPQRWKVCIAQVNTNMGMAVGSMFVSRYFDNNSKRDTLRMTHDLQQAFREILKTTDWLDSTTKKLAEEKVNAMSLKIGYPDFILNASELNRKYHGIDIHPDRYFENTLNVLLHTARTEQAKLHERVNKTNWQTAPAIVNAYYSRNKNQIMFPAGILQPPFYHRHFPKSLNFGGIGVVIGHELTHGFDDKGRLFDRNGNIHKWWTDSSIRGFDERARCIIAQYSNYTVEEVGISLNGESTQGENIADNGGLRQAFHAYMRWLKQHPHEAKGEMLPGLNMTGPQLFFLNFGQVWCGAMRPEAIRNKLNTAIHSPGRFRVIGTLSNSHDFAREFSCATGTPMNPVNKCSVW